MNWKLAGIGTICYLLSFSSFADNSQIIVGEYASVKNNPLPLIAVNQTENNWIYPTLPELPSGIFGVTMSDANCNSKFCAAVGGFHFDDRQYSPLIAVSFNQGQQWSYINKLGEKNNRIGEMFSLSCNSDLCVAVGVEYSQGHDYIPLLSVAHGDQWDVPNSVITNLPFDFATGEFGNVTCNNSFCLAAGEYDSKNGQNYPLVAISSDKEKVRWEYLSNIASLLPKDVKITDVLGLNCTDKVCAISGLYRLPSDKQIAYLVTSYDNGKTWALPADITSKLPDSDDSRLDKVKCYKNLCIAVGSYHPNHIDRSVLNYIPLIALSHDTGKTWSYVTNFKLPKSYSNAELWNIGCNEKVCLAGGQYSLPSQATFPFLLYSKDQGETWSLMNELPKDFGNGGDFTGGISCNDASCLALGSYKNNTNRYLPLMITTLDGNKWSYPSSVIQNLPKDFSYGRVSTPTNS